MARECFCGCGRTIPLYMMGLRTYDKRGKQVSARLAWMREQLDGPYPAVQPDSEQWLEEWLRDGDEFAEQIAMVVHREADPRGVDESAIRQWQAEGRRMEREAEREAMERQARFGRAVRESGRSYEEVTHQLAHRGAEEVFQAIERGDADPFGFESSPGPGTPES